MRHGAKYLLVVTILLAGYSAALQHKTLAPPEPAASPSPPAPAVAWQPRPTPPAASQLPLAALVDSERSPSAVERKPAPSVSKQPTLERTAPPPDLAKSFQPRSEAAADKTTPVPKKDDPPPSVAANKDSAAKDAKASTPKAKPADQKSAADKPATDRKAGDKPDRAGKDNKRSGETRKNSEKPREPALMHDPFAAAAMAERQPPQDKPAGPRQHRIAAGDTLAKLADKYLGDRARATDIYQANAGVLPDPRLLPIGVEIAIPGQTKDGKDKRAESKKGTTPVPPSMRPLPPVTP